MGSGFSKFKKQAKLIQKQYAQIQDEMQSLRIVGSAGNGLVEVTVNGDKEIIAIQIKPDCVDKEDIEGLQDLILDACHDAFAKVKEQSPENSLSGFPQF